MAENVSFDTCVTRLFSVGGMSKADAVFYCYRPVSSDLLDCQNKKFLIEFNDPKSALNFCATNPGKYDFNIDDTYHGSFEAPPHESDNRKTVCSITINSKEEREAFRSELNNRDYNWVELIPFNKPEDSNRFMVRDNQWLDRACQKKIRCDIMVFSGHFASSFIGSSGHEVKLEDLTKYSCDKNCETTFESVRQVYLFGCNTLAQNAPDSRTIAAYREILIQDGVSPHSAQQIAARRYTIYGQTISDEVRKIFPKARQIFGFAAPGPTGKNIKPALVKYLRGEDFKTTLGKTGMKEVPPLVRDDLTCSTELNLVRNSTLKTKTGLASYAARYGLIIPVAAVDLIAEAKNKKYITTLEYNELIQNVFKLYETKNIAVKRHMLCPILATKNANLVPASLLCLETLGQPKDKNSWANSQPE